MDQTVLHIIRRYFKTQPIVRAWVFGSFARNEDNESSDIDILVTLDKDAHIGLMKFANMSLELENLLNRPVDLVAEDSLKSYVADSVNYDKKLIYERS